MESDMKTCTKCGEIKPLTEFRNRKGMKDGKRSECKLCSQACVRAWQEKNRELTCIAARHWREENPDRYLASKRQWYEKNTAKQCEYSKKWRSENREQAKANDLRRHHRNKSRPEYRAGRAIRDVLASFLRRASRDKSGSTCDILGYSADALSEHLERQFLKGMSWDNYGKDWHIDHIVSVAEYIRSGVTDPAVVNCLTNLRPMWVKDNLRKSDKRTHLL